MEADVDDDLFVRSVRFERFISRETEGPPRPRGIDRRAIRSLDDLVEALGVRFERVKSARADGRRQERARLRPLAGLGAPTSHHDAEAAFLKGTSHVDELRERRYPEMGASWTERNLCRTT